MNTHQDWDDLKLEAELETITGTVWVIAKQCQGNSRALLSVLRTLETLHRAIQTQLFEPSLPNTRQALYQMLKEIEETGGWPYVERMRLQELLRHWLAETAESTDSQELTEEASNL